MVNQRRRTVRACSLAPSTQLAMADLTVGLALINLIDRKVTPNRAA